MMDGSYLPMLLPKVSESLDTIAPRDPVHPAIAARRHYIRQVSPALRGRSLAGWFMNVQKLNYDAGLEANDPYDQILKAWSLLHQTQLTLQLPPRPPHRTNF
jgi:hypothetical protein